MKSIKAAKNRLYECLDRIDAHRSALFTHLRFVKITVPKARQPVNPDTFKFELLKDKLPRPGSDPARGLGETGLGVAASTPAADALCPSAGGQVRARDEVENVVETF